MSSKVKIIKILDAVTLSDTSPGLTQKRYTEKQNIEQHDFSKDIGLVLFNSGTSTDFDVYYEIGVPTLDKNVAIGADTFFGSGVNDITVAGTFNATNLPTNWTAMQRRYRVEIDATGTPDTYKWSRDGGVNWVATGVSVTSSAVELEDGITVLWTATTGHTLAEAWEFDVTNLVWLNSTKNVDAASTTTILDSETLKPCKWIRFQFDNQSATATAIVSAYLILNVNT